MNRHVLKKKWNHILNDVKERWGNLSQDDLDRIAGDYDLLVSSIGRRYHLTRNLAKGEVHEFLNKLDVRQRLAS